MSESRPSTHLLPRTRDGWIATIAFVALFLLSMPPVSHSILDRPGSWIAGWPYFFVALFVIYSGLIAILVWALRRGV